MKSLNKLYLIFFLPALFVGCDVLKVKNEDVLVAKSVAVSSDVQVITDSMKSVSKDDAKLMYMQFGGLVEYMTHTKNVTTTKELVQLIAEFQTDYGYTREKYTEYTDAVEAFLMKQGYKQPKTIVDVASEENQVARSKVIADIKVIADAAKLVMEKK